jgi:hypothetical protein
VRLRMARCLEGCDTHPSVADALAVLGNDSAEQAAHDEALVRQWRQAHGIVVDTAGARARIAARLEQMAARQQAYEARDGWSPA